MQYLYAIYVAELCYVEVAYMWESLSQNNFVSFIRLSKDNLRLVSDLLTSHVQTQCVLNRIE